MKHSIKTMVTLFVSFAFYNLSSGQDMATHSPAPASELSIPAGENKTGENIAVANFTSLFPNASGQKWTLHNGNSFVSFINDGRKATASFNAKGDMNYAITQCGINDLPAAFGKIIKNEYAAYRLFNATQIKAHGETAYQAVLENAAGFVTLKYTADGVEEVQAVKK